jgi:uncharacterized protein (TIGR01777 family)
MRVLVTGGKGFIGRALARSLDERGDEAVVVSREGGAGAVGWDAIESEVERADAVVHLAGEPIADARWTPSRLERIRDSRVRTTETIARAIERAAHKPRVLVSGSAVGVYGLRTDDEELDEGSPPGDDVLARMAVAWEGAAAPARAAGVRVVHPRTGVVLGSGGGVLAKMAGPFRWFAGGPLGDGRQWLSWIHIRDTVRGLLFALDSSALAGPYNLVAPQPCTMGAFAVELGRALNRPAAIRVPAFALRLALGDGVARLLLTGQRALPRKLLAAGFAFEFPGLREALFDLL